MELRIRDSDYAKQAARAAWGDFQTVEAVADLLRTEVTSRGSCTRWAAVRRVEQAASLLAEVDRESIDAMCQQLLAQGDFIASKGGILHVTPVRALTVRAVEYRLISSLPTARLTSKLPGQVSAQNSRRSLNLSEGEGGALKEAVECLGGHILSPEEWAGLDLAPEADDAWLVALDERLRWLPEAAGSQERDEALEWRALTLTNDGPRFRRPEGQPAQLWRAKDSLGRWLWAWSRPDSPPTTSAFVTLSWDDANRTVFALARTMKTPVCATLVRTALEATLRLGAWLPRAEYRYLATLATPAGDNQKNTWSVPTSRINEVLQTLHRRLGIHSIEETRG